MADELAVRHEPADDRTDELFARARLACAIRDLAHTFVGRNASAADLHEAADCIEQVLATRHWDGPREQAAATQTNRYLLPLPEDGATLPTSPDRAIAGIANPYGIPLEYRYRAPWVETSLTLGPAYEGANRLAHGGLVAAVFDDITGIVQHTIGVMAVTGQLTVTYLAGVPLDVPLRFRARLARRDGRKLIIAAEASQGDTKLARAEALWVQIPSERFGLPAGIRES